MSDILYVSATFQDKEREQISAQKRQFADAISYLFGTENKVNLLILQFSDIFYHALIK